MIQQVMSLSVGDEITRNQEDTPDTSGLTNLLKGFTFKITQTEGCITGEVTKAPSPELVGRSFAIPTRYLTERYFDRVTQ